MSARYIPDFDPQPGKRFTMLAKPGHNESAQPKEITIAVKMPIGSGSFGTVYSAKLLDTKETVAIKKAVIDKKVFNRELKIMQEMQHQNLVDLKYYFYTKSIQDDTYLNLIMEYMPETLHNMCRHYYDLDLQIPIGYVKLYTYQMFRGFAYMHGKGICHRDIKPQNILLDPETGLLKIIDFGSAKKLIRGDVNVAYICSRYYRAPELIFGATQYETSIDLWSAGCVVAEILRGRTLFSGDSNVDQLVEIIKVLGTPTNAQVKLLNPTYNGSKLPEVKTVPWATVFRKKTDPVAIDLVAEMLKYDPNSRLKFSKGLFHQFFDDLKKNGAKMPNGRSLPNLFNFTEFELKISPSLRSLMAPV